MHCRRSRKISPATSSCASRCSRPAGSATTTDLMPSMMKLPSLVLALAGAGLVAALAGPAAAQGLRPSQQLRPNAAPAAANGTRSADYIVVVVNSEPITNNEVRVRMLRYEQQLAQQGSPLPPRPQL